MNDLDFARRVSEPVRVLYAEAKRSRHQFPRNTLIAARSLASLCCDILRTDAAGDWPVGLDDKIRELGRARSINPGTRHRLDQLRRWGNQAAHPEAGMVDDTQFKDLAGQALDVVRELLETAFQVRHAGAALPRYEIADEDPDVLSEACFRAVIENSAPDQYLVAMTLQAQLSAQIAHAKAQPDADAQLLALGIAARGTEDRVLDLLRYACDAGYPAARYKYGLALSEGQRGESMMAFGRNLIALAADDDDIDALAWCGRDAMFGLHDNPVDYGRAREYLERAAAEDHPMALTLLAEIWRSGLGVEPDPHAAFRLALRAADAGYPSAQYEVAFAMARGNGTEPDQDEASKWLRRASDAGLSTAQYVVAKSILSGEMAGSQEEVERLLKDATRTVTMAHLDLAELYMQKNDLRQWMDAAVMIQHAYERALAENNEKVTQRCLAVAPGAIARLEAAHAGLPDELATDFLLARFMFDEERKPYPDRGQRIGRWIEARNELLRVRHTGLPAEQRLMRELASGMGTPAPRAAIDVRPTAAQPVAQRVTVAKVGRNELCPCGSGKKAKKCPCPVNRILSR